MRVSESIALSAHTAADVSDACDDLELPCVRSGSLRPMWPGCPRLTGPIATLTLRPARERDENPLPPLLRAMAELAGRIVLVDLDGRTDVQCWGGVLTACAQRFDIPGVIVHGPVRDVETLAERHFPTFASGVYPARIRGRLRLTSVHADVAIAGGVVHSGDVVVADADGVVFLSADRAADVALRAAARAADERRALDRLRAGEDPRDVFGVD
jgi:regulator of RNase E activity RraA